MKQWLIFLLLFALAFTGCKKGTPEMTKSELEEGLKEVLKKHNVEYDSIRNIEARSAEVTQKDKDSMKGKFSGKVEGKKLDVSFELIRASAKTHGEYSIIWAYYENKWIPVVSYTKEAAEWKDEITSETPTSAMMKALKELKLPQFPNGELGKETNTTIEVVKRDLAKEVGRETILAKVRVKADNANYAFDTRFVFQHKDGEWVCEEVHPQEADLWQVDFNSAELPKDISKEAVLDKLNQRANWKTYIVQMDAADDVKIEQVKKESDSGKLVYIYEVDISYPFYKKEKYEVHVPYQWEEGAWREKEYTLTLLNRDYNPMLGKWIAESGHMLVLESAGLSKQDNRLEIRGKTFAKEGEAAQAKFLFSFGEPKDILLLQGDVEQYEGISGMTKPMMEKDVKISWEKASPVLEVFGERFIPKEDTKHEDATVSTSGITLNNLEVSVPAYVIEGENYFKIRDLAFVLKETEAKFAVDYNYKLDGIEVFRGKDYSPTKDDCQPIRNEKSVGVRSRDKLFVDGVPTAIKAYKIEGYNYFKLKDLAEIIGFKVSYDFDTNKVNITSTSTSSSKDTPKKDEPKKDDKDSPKTEDKENPKKDDKTENVETNEEKPKEDTPSIFEESSEGKEEDNEEEESSIFDQ